LLHEEEKEHFLDESEKNYRETVKIDEKEDFSPEELFSDSFEPQTDEIPAAGFSSEAEEPPIRISSETPSISMEERDDILKKTEDKLTLAVKEMLWEILPPLAEKIIKEEIEKITGTIEES